MATQNKILGLAFLGLFYLAGCSSPHIVNTGKVIYDKDRETYSTTVCIEGNYSKRPELPLAAERAAQSNLKRVCPSGDSETCPNLDEVVNTWRGSCLYATTSTITAIDRVLRDGRELLKKGAAGAKELYEGPEGDKARDLYHRGSKKLQDLLK